MAMVRGSFIDLSRIIREHSQKVTNIQDIQMGQLNGYDALQNSMMQQNLNNNPFLNTLAGQSGLGLGGLGQYIPPPPNTIPKPGIREAFGGHHLLLEVAKSYGYEYSSNKDAFVHKNGSFVSMKMIQDRTGLVEELSIKGRTPNITWLNERVDEIRVKLC